MTDYDYTIIPEPWSPTRRVTQLGMSMDVYMSYRAADSSGKIVARGLSYEQQRFVKAWCAAFPSVFR